MAGEGIWIIIVATQVSDASIAERAIFVVVFPFILLASVLRILVIIELLHTAVNTFYLDFGTIFLNC